MSTFPVVLSVLLALVFLAAGAGKFSGSELAKGTPEHLGISPSFYKLGGVLELLAALGLVLAALGVVPELLGALAAFGLGGLMLGAVALHQRAGDSFAPGKENPSPSAPALILLIISLVTGALILS